MPIARSTRFNDRHLAEIIATTIEIGGVLVIGIGVIAAASVSIRIKLADREAVTYVAARPWMNRGPRFSCSSWGSWNTDVARRL